MNFFKNLVYNLLQEFFIYSIFISIGIFNLIFTCRRFILDTKSKQKAGYETPFNIQSPKTTR